MNWKAVTIITPIFIMLFNNNACAEQKPTISAMLGTSTGSTELRDNPTPSQESGLTLGPGDTINIAAYERPDLSGTFRVRSDGAVSMPLVGSVRASGRSLAELERAISQEITRQTNKVVPLSLEVSEWRPVYTVGDVDKPGLQAFRPGMTALQALSAAGGVLRLANNTDSPMLLAREATAVLRIIEQLKAALAEEARLRAEREGEQQIRIPKLLDRLAAPEEAKGLLAAETKIMLQNREKLRQNVERKDKEISIINREIASFKLQNEEIEKRKQLIVAELEKYDRLSEKGLARSSRVLQLRSEIASLDANIQTVIASIERANRDLVAYQQEKALLFVDKNLQLDQGIKDTVRLVRELDGSRKLYANLIGGMPAFIASTLDQEPGVVTFRINRLVNGRMVTIPARETTPLRPADVLRVTKVESPLSFPN